MGAYSRNNPFQASIKERFCLCGPGTEKSTRHIVLDLKGSGIKYRAGDSIGIYPTNHPGLVSQTVNALRATEQDLVVHSRSGQEMLLGDLLKQKANITEVSRKLVAEIQLRQTNPEKRDFLLNLLNNSDKKLIKDYIASRELWDLLLEHHEVQFPTQEICDLLMPLLPRLYSIASSQEAVGDEVHLTVAMLKYSSNNHERQGVCTHYLGEQTLLQEPVVPVYLQETKDFILPEDPSTPVIMIGPGTGVAPFRAFMQHRHHTGASGKNWLFFGEWNRDKHFFYEDFWADLRQRGSLKLDLAFSRDQEHKVYVQHKMLENGKELYSWLQNGACLYVCGDKNRMAKDVEEALIQIIQNHGNYTPEDAQAYIKTLRKEKRYLKDVY